jgi:hypothetical protein
MFFPNFEKNESDLSILVSDQSALLSGGATFDRTREPTRHFNIECPTTNPASRTLRSNRP